MSAEYVRHTYGVDYRQGERLIVDGQIGTLVSFPGQYLGVRFDGHRRTSRCHPTWEVYRADDVHPFSENVNDASMCVCGIPDLYHAEALKGRQIEA